MLVTSLEFRDDVVLVKLGADVIEAEWKGEPQAFLDYLAGDASVNWTEVYRQLGDPG